MKYIFYFFVLIVSISCRTNTIDKHSNPLDFADFIFTNGTIITMEEDMKQAETVVVKNGKIIAVGDRDLVKTHLSDNTRIIDLDGKIMLPGFIDAHSHFSIAMRMISQVNISAPPVSDVTSVDNIINKLIVRKTNQNIQAGQWIMAWGYDPDLLSEKRHPNKLDLDSLFPDNPVFLLHVSGHMAVVNTKALEIAGINEQTKDPSGGVIVRLPDSNEPNGLLQETAMYSIFPHLPTPNPEQVFGLLQATQKFYAAHGITTAQDGRTDLEVYQMLVAASQKEKFLIDINCLANIDQAKLFLENDNFQFGRSTNGVTLSGFKLVGDGSPQGKTAYFSKSYLTQVPGCQSNCRGFPNVPQERINDLVRMAYKNNIQLFSHANGDASIDMLLEAHVHATDSLHINGDDLRTVVIHSQFVRPDQLVKYKDYGFVPSFFTNHAFYWGDVHLENLGKERANFLSPLQSAIDKDIISTNHTDYIITPLDQLFLLWTAVNRISRKGEIIGASQRVTPWEGLKAITINAAYQHRQEHRKGSIKEAKLADFVILDKNPLTVPPNEIRDIKVLKTIKEGVIVYDRNSASAAAF